MTDKFFNWIVFDLWFSQKKIFFQNLKIVLLRGICTFSTIYELYYFRDRTKWIRTKRGPPVLSILINIKKYWMTLSRVGHLKKYIFLSYTYQMQLAENKKDSRASL